MSETIAQTVAFPLFRIGEILAEPGAAASVLWSAKRQIAQWAVDFLCTGNPELGRTGPVCPWTRPSIDMATFWLCSFAESDPRDPSLRAKLTSLADRFLTLEPGSGPKTQFKTVVAVLPALPQGSDVELLHDALKPHFLRHGLMLGEFHASCVKRGIRSREFFPLRSPLPLLVVREMVEFDILFLAESLEFAELYLNRFGSRGLQAIQRVLERRSTVMLDDLPLSNLQYLIASHARATV